MSFWKSPSFVGVDLGAGGVKMVELKLEKKRPVLTTYGLTTVAQDVHKLLSKTDAGVVELVEKGRTGGLTKTRVGQESNAFVVDKNQIDRYVKVITSVARQAHITSKLAVVSMPVSAVFHAVVTLPVLKHEEFEKVLRAEVKKLLPYPLEEAELDYEIMSVDSLGKTQSVLVNAVPRALVAFYTQIFKQAGFKLLALEPESIALSRALVGKDASVTLLVDIGAERTNFFIIENTIPITHHSIELGGEKINALLKNNNLLIEESAVEQIKRDLFTCLLEKGSVGLLTKQKFVPMFTPVVEPILKEIEYSLELYLRQSHNEQKRPEKVVLTGGGALFPYLAELIEDKFKLKSYIGDPWGRVLYQESLKPVLRSIAPRMAVAIGLALRNMI